MDLFRLNPIAFGLDISDLSLKIVKLKKKGKFFQLASFGEFAIAPGIIEKGEIKDEKALIEIIKNSLLQVRGEKLKTKHIIASLPETRAFLQVIPMPVLEEEELLGAVKYEAENYIPFSVDEVYLDFQVVEPLYDHLDHVDVLIVAIPKNIVDSYTDLFKKTGLRPLALEVESQATARALIKNQVSPRPILIIDLGASRTSFIIFSGFSLKFTSSIPVCGSTLTQAISKNLGVSINEAESIKIDYGILEDKEITLNDGTKRKIKKESIFEALTPALTDLVEQIKACLEYYQTHISHEHLPSDGKAIQKLLLCGGGARIKGICEFLSGELKIPAELGDPWVNVLKTPLEEIPEIPFDQSVEYATAIGLALRGTTSNF